MTMIMKLRDKNTLPLAVPKVLHKTQAFVIPGLGALGIS